MILPIDDLYQLVVQCAPNVAPNTMIAIIKTESRGNPLAIGLNKGKKLRYQPRDINQMIQWVNYLEKHNYNFDIGLAQINIRNVHKYGFSAKDVVYPCKNLEIAADILLKNYRNSLQKSPFSKHTALLKAISAYNTGTYSKGFQNGYVQKVIKNSRSPTK